MAGHQSIKNTVTPSGVMLSSLSNLCWRPDTKNVALPFGRKLGLAINQCEQYIVANCWTYVEGLITINRCWAIMESFGPAHRVKKYNMYNNFEVP